MARSRSRRRRRRSPSEQDAASQEPSLEERVVFLEVENETLKAENRELRKKLTEVLRASRGRSSAKSGDAANRSPSDMPDDLAHRRKAKAVNDVPDELSHRRRAKPTESAGDVPDDLAHRRRCKNVNDEEGNPLVAASQRKAKETGAETSKSKVQSSGGGDRDNERNAVMLANSFGEVYNEQIPSNIAAEKRGPLVNAKIDRFFAHFDDKCQIVDLKSDGKIIKDRKMFSMRYNCVFRESGTKLKCVTHKRFYYDWVAAPTFVLDFETHESLVTATPGTRPDGSLGCRDPRTEHLIVLYEERNGKVSQMWLAQDADKLGLDPTAGEHILLRSALVKQFEKKIEERREGKIADRIFHNYHDVATIG